MVVGIDVAKASCAVALRHADGKFTEKVFANSLEGAASCIAFFKETGVSEETPVVLESTGGYHLLFAMTIKDAHFHGIKVINAILTKKYQKSKIRKTKTDSADAKMLANMALFEDLPKFTQTREQLIQKKRLTILRQLQKSQQALQASLENTLETAKNLGIIIDTFGIEKVLVEIETAIKTIQKDILIFGKNPLAEKLTEIKGVSASAATIIASFFVGKNFRSKDQLVAFTGLDLSVRESGTSIHGQRHLSKRGDPFLRKKLFQTAWALKMHNQKYKDHYLKKRLEKKHYYTCVLSVARKFVHHIYALQKSLPQNILPSQQPL